MFLADFDEFRGRFFTIPIFTFDRIFRIIMAHSEMISSFHLAYKLPAHSPELRIGAISERKRRFLRYFL